MLVFVAVVAVAVGLRLAAGTDRHGAQVISYSVNGPGTNGTLPQAAVIPAGAAKMPPLVVFLHGKGQTQTSNLTSAFYVALSRLGSRAPDLVFPYGGEDSYWHNRADGAWGTYVLHDVIPQAVRRLHADPSRVAIAGLSMGGFGAYDLARQAPGRFCAIGADSAALWASGGETAPGAFDDAEDFERHNVIAATRSSSNPYPGAKLWLDVGSEDPFRAADTTLASMLKAKGTAVDFHIWPGGHNQSYWDSHWTESLAFYADALSGCVRPRSDAG
ncbi:MAG TPA: alpha/beta hydrolase-fold protein [Solirubrobacteraceae bacterium]|jgi:S-formylglutathione hydrolase FrmB|nr:alpha/beta hydrolase-fold protein [Solirubrobacteraceae bacterium]